MRHALSSAIIVALLMALAPAAVRAQAQECEAFHQSTEQVLPGVTLTWDSSFLCENASGGEYTFTVNVSNDGASVEAVTIDSFALSHTTPRPRGAGPDASVTGVTGLPLTLEAGESGQFTVTGTYELVTTDEGSKANLHFIASGYGATSGEWFGLGVNAHFRGEGTVEGDSNNADKGPPSWAGGPPPWAGGN